MADSTKSLLIARTPKVPNITKKNSRAMTLKGILKRDNLAGSNIRPKKKTAVTGKEALAIVMTSKIEIYLQTME
jgi:hypothetical protein